MRIKFLLPILIAIFVFSDAANAGRKNPKKELEKQNQDKYIVLCNEKGNPSTCNKIWKSNWKKITNEKYISSKKGQARSSLNRCIKFYDGSHCWYLSDNLHELDWIKNEIKEENIVQIELLKNSYLTDLKNKAESYTKPKFDKIGLLRDCEDLIRANLKDPKSYQRINSRYMQEATGIIEYTATNSFGGRVKDVFKCFTP